MSIEISQETEGRLVAEATRLGVSLETLLEQLLDDLEVRAPAAPDGPRPALPTFHLGAVGTLRRSEIFGDAD